MEGIGVESISKPFPGGVSSTQVGVSVGGTHGVGISMTPVDVGVTVVGIGVGTGVVGTGVVGTRVVGTGVVGTGLLVRCGRRLSRWDHGGGDCRGWNLGGRHRSGRYYCGWDSGGWHGRRNDGSGRRRSLRRSCGRWGQSCWHDARRNGSRHRRTRGRINRIDYGGLSNINRRQRRRHHRCRCCRNDQPDCWRSSGFVLFRCRQDLILLQIFQDSRQNGRQS